LKVNKLLPDILLANLFRQECPGCVSLTFDGWTSKIMTSYLVITSHWLLSEWELRLELLSFSELEGSHSRENNGQEFYEFLQKYDIFDKVITIIYGSISISEKII
jgi:hypothetical protein